MAVCLGCNKEYVVHRNSVGVYCSNQCQQTHRQWEQYLRWCDGQEVTAVTRTMGNMLRKFEGNRCSVCHIAEWNGKPLKMQCDHIDGNPENNAYSNMRLICPNCDAQSTTYKGRNFGNGRYARRQRYANGTSY